MYVSKSGLARVGGAAEEHICSEKQPDHQVKAGQLMNCDDHRSKPHILLFFNHFLDLISDDKNKVLPIFNIIQPRYPHICNYNSDCIEQRVASSFPR